MLARVTPLLVASVLLASVLLTACTTSGPRNPAYDRYLKLGDDLASRGDPVSAGALYEKAAQLPAAGIDAWLKLGQARLDGGDARGAERAYQQALEQSPEHAEALLGLGTAQLRQGRFDRAAMALAQAAALSNQPSAYSRLGIAQMLRGQAEAAQAAFTRARLLAPADLDIQCNQALAQALSGQGEAAFTSVRALLQSPRVQARQQRNALLVAVLTGHEAAVPGLGLDDIPAPQRPALIEQAREIKALATPAAQAQALGLVNAQ
jgi:Flp pilus assembly protein TadD